MELKKTFILAAATAMLAGAAGAHEMTKDQMKNKEKCYGIAKGGKNDCAWAGGSCSGSATKDGEKTAWILLPKGACGKIVGGTLKAE